MSTKDRWNERRPPMELFRALATMAVALVAAAGCAQPDRRPAEPVAAAWEAPPPVAPAPHAEPAAPEPTTQPREMPTPARPVADTTVARVNGEPILRSALIDALVEAQGLNMLEKLVVSAVLRQEAARHGITVTDADIEAEHRDALRRIAAPLAFGPDEQEAEAFDAEAAETLLDEFLTAKNISRTEFHIRMQQNAYLRKLAAREITTTESQLADEYERAYGEKVQVRCIQMGSPDAVKRVRAALAEGKDFEVVAQQMSENRYIASRGGLLPPFTRYDDVPKLLRDAAFALEPGQVSSTIHENNAFYILRVERRFAPSQVGIANVRDELEKRLTDRMIRQRMDALSGELFSAATIDIRDTELRKGFRKRYPDARVSRSGP
ncbi:MAG: peptidylprolyl isomerase [Phycisphaerae bacterium]|nr:peptidylprolyl isomerase [Phycisphaerae bacterium]